MDDSPWTNVPAWMPSQEPPLSKKSFKALDSSLDRKFPVVDTKTKVLKSLKLPLVNMAESSVAATDQPFSLAMELTRLIPWGMLDLELRVRKYSLSNKDRRLALHGDNQPSWRKRGG